MEPPFPSLTRLWHNDTYPAIDVTRPELSVKGKKAIISGGGTGIGAGIAQAFADAGAASIAIFGRRDNVLQDTKRSIESKSDKVSITTHIADVTDPEALRKAAREIGSWDILISNAGYAPAPTPILESDPSAFWRTFEINVKGPFNTVQALLPTRNQATATVISMNAGSIQNSGPPSRRQSAYNSSKFASLKFFEILALEHPDLHVVNMHPGIGAEVSVAAAAAAATDTRVRPDT